MTTQGGVMTTQTEMYEQTQAFPKTKLDLAEEFLKHFQSDVESAEKSLLNARVKLGAAQILRNDAEENLRRERIAEGIASPEEIALDMKRSAEAADMGLSFRVNGEEPIVIAEPPAVDPITGEVESIPAADWKCPTCRGDGRLPDKTGGGHHRCKDCNGTGHVEPSCDNCTSPSCNLKQRAGSSTMGCGGRSWLHGEKMGEPNVSVVVVLYPGDDEPHVTKVGDRTRYSELVADYFTEAGLNAEVDADHWTVVARRELTQDGRGYRSLHDVIVADDYGQELLVVALEQGSVVGEQADASEANELLEDAVR